MLLNCSPGDAHQNSDHHTDLCAAQDVNWERAEHRQLLRHCAKITRSQSSTWTTIRWERAEHRQLLRHCAKITRSQSSTLTTIRWRGRRTGNCCGTAREYDAHRAQPWLQSAGRWRRVSCSSVLGQQGRDIGVGCGGKEATVDGRYKPRTWHSRGAALKQWATVARSMARNATIIRVESMNSRGGEAKGRKEHGTHS